MNNTNLSQTRYNPNRDFTKGFNSEPGSAFKEGENFTYDSVFTDPAYDDLIAEGKRAINAPRKI